MSDQQAPMPKFDAPPVVETVFGVHFVPPSGFDVAKRVLFWSEFQDDFPRLEEKVPIDEIREDFGEGRSATGTQIRWQLTSAPPSPRLWAKSDDEKHTIQIQQDALLVNWERDPQRDDAYWDYNARRRDLAEKLGRLDEFFRRHTIGEVKPTTCFATYINHIEYDPPGRFAPLLERLLAVWCSELSDNYLPPLEEASIRMAFPFPEYHGRLHVHVAPGVRRKDKSRIVRMDLTARGTPHEPTIEAALDWIDRGHEWIVRGFASLTRSKMHEHWRRIQ